MDLIKCKMFIIDLGKELGLHAEIIKKLPRPKLPEQSFDIMSKGNVSMVIVLVLSRRHLNIDMHFAGWMTL